MKLTSVYQGREFRQHAQRWHQPPWRSADAKNTGHCGRSLACPWQHRQRSSRGRTPPLARRPRQQNSCHILHTHTTNKTKHTTQQTHQQHATRPCKEGQRSIRFMHFIVMQVETAYTIIKHGMQVFSVISWSKKITKAYICLGCFLDTICKIFFKTIQIHAHLTPSAFLLLFVCLLNQ